MSLLFVSLVTTLPGSVYAVSPTPGEIAAAHQWMSARFQKNGQPPFSFRYDGKASTALLPTWQVRHATAQAPQSTRRTLIYTDSQTGLEVRCVATEYADFPAVEWGVTFRNKGTQDSPILEAVRAADFALTSPRGDFQVRY